MMLGWWNMRLEVRNIGKIDYANVKLDGMTVLVGSNSTGKSTISKSLYTIIRGFHNFDGSLEAEKNRRIIKCLRNWTRQMYEKIPRIIKKDEIRRNTENHIPSLIEELRKIKDKFRGDYITISGGLTYEKINIETRDDFVKEIRYIYDLDYVESFFNDNFPFIFDSVKEVINKLDDVYDEILVLVNDSTVMRQVITNIIEECMDGNFSSQFNLMDSSGVYFYNKSEEETYISLERKISDDIEETVEVNDNNVDENIVYIQPMHILDDNFMGRISDFSICDLLRNQLLDERGTKEVEDIDLSVELLERINDIMQEKDVFDNEPVGEVSTEKNGFINRILYQDSQLNNAITFNNVASGIKNIVIIKRLISNIVLKKESFLVFDEPEVNLHPDWQLKFAKILAMLQKELKLKILINTHSPYFMRALECYCDHYDILDNLNIYHMEHSEKNLNQYYAKNITDEENGVANLYQELSRPFVKLQEMLEKKYGEDE